jgi:hypothetical protein
MNRNTASLQSRLLGAAAAALASTLVLTSVLWLFSSVDTGAVSQAQPQVLASGNDHAGAASVRAR